MFVRELIQNAHDAIVKRQYYEPSLAGRIDIIADREASIIAFEDNGVGMTKIEIEDHLATIGRSGTRELREQIKARDLERAQNLIGQFGIGILSAFVVSEKITVDTKSRLDDSDALRFSISGGPEYDLEYINKDSVGSIVTVHLKSDYIEMTNQERLEKAVRTYSDFLPIPIYLNNKGPINTIDAPWHKHYSKKNERVKAYSNWLKDRFYPDDPLEIIPVSMDTPHPVNGVLYITERHIPDSDAAGMVDIYQSRMFVREGDRNILPPWAKFIRGVIDSPALTPTAARDAVQEDRVYHEIHKSLGRLVIDHLKELAKEDPDRFQRLMGWHHYHVMAAALHFDDFFDAVGDLIPVEVNNPDGNDRTHPILIMTLPEYIKLQNKSDDEGKKIVYYISEKGATPQFYRLCQAKGILAINASTVFTEEFLKKYEDKHKEEMSLSGLDIAEGSDIFEPLSETEHQSYLNLEYKLEMLLRRARPEQETIVRAQHYKPPEIPSVLTQTEDIEIISKLEELTVHPAVSSKLSKEFAEAFGLMQRRQRPVVLHINASSPLVERLHKEDFEDPLIQDIWLTVYNSAFMVSGKYLNAQNLESLFAQTVQALGKVLELREEMRKLKLKISDLTVEDQANLASSPLNRTSHVSLFLMMPYKDEYKILEKALRQVLEDDPYNFQVILASDKTLRSNLFDNVKAHMRLVHGFICDLSELNPNVMVELGITEADTEDRPVIILRRKGSMELPADLKAKLSIEYELPPTGDAKSVEQLADQLRSDFDNIEAIDKLSENKRERYLSVAYLSHVCSKKRLVLSINEAEKLSKEFQTIDALERSNKLEVMNRTGFDDALSGMIEAAFCKH